MLSHPKSFILVVYACSLFSLQASAQNSKTSKIKITNSQLAAINVGLDSSEYWLNKMKDGDQRRGATLLNDLQKLTTRFNRIPETDDEQFKYVASRFNTLTARIKEKIGRKTVGSERPPASIGKQTQEKPHRNLFTLNRQLDDLERSLKSVDADNLNAITRLRAQLVDAKRIFSSIPNNKHPEFLAAVSRLKDLSQKCNQLIPQWGSKQNPADFLTQMRQKYVKTLALPRAQRLMSTRELTDQDVKLFLGSISAFGADLDKDLAKIKAASIATGTASDLVAWVEKESVEFIRSESDKLKNRLDRFVETALKDAQNLAGLDPQKNKYTFVTESVRKNTEAKFARALRTLENARSLEDAFNLPGRWTTKKAELEKHISAYREKAALATTVERLPVDVGSKELIEVATKTLSIEKYGIGQIERLIVNSKIVPRDRVQTRYFNGALETTVRKWEEFQVCTVEIEGGKHVVYFNTLKKFSRGPATTPIGKWILSVRFKSGEIKKENLK